MAVGLLVLIGSSLLFMIVALAVVEALSWLAKTIKNAYS